jgi:hypothetical protein
MMALFILLLFIYMIYNYTMSPSSIPLDYLVDYLNVKNGSTMDFSINVRGITGEDCNISGSYNGITYNIRSDGELEKCSSFNNSSSSALASISGGGLDEKGRLKSSYYDD